MIITYRIYMAGYHIILACIKPMRSNSSGKRMRRVCGRFEVQVPMGMYLCKRKIILANINFSDAFYRIAVFALVKVPQAP